MQDDQPFLPMKVVELFYSWSFVLSNKKLLKTKGEKADPDER